MHAEYLAFFYFQQHASYRKKTWGNSKDLLRRRWRQRYCLSTLETMAYAEVCKSCTRLDTQNWRNELRMRLILIWTTFCSCRGCSRNIWDNKRIFSCKGAHSVSRFYNCQILRSARFCSLFSTCFCIGFSVTRCCKRVKSHNSYILRMNSLSGITRMIAGLYAFCGRMRSISRGLVTLLEELRALDKQ